MRAETAHCAIGLPRLVDDERVTEDLRETRAIYRSVQRRCGLAVGAANLIGGILVFVLGVFVVPEPKVADEAGLQRLNVLLFAVLGIVGGVLGTWLLLRMARRGATWLLEGRNPSAAELAATLGFPKRLARLEASLWAAAIVPFTALNAAYSTELGFYCAIEMALGGVTVVALSYLLTERMERPVIARALERAHAAPPGGTCPGVASRLTLAWLFGATVPLVSIALVGVAVLSDVPATRHQIGWAVVVLGAVGVLAGLLVIWIAGRTLTEPLTALRGALGRVEGGDLAASVEVDDASEIGRLQSGFNKMVSGLRERDRLLDLFGRQVGEEVAREALERDGVELGGETRDAAVLFVDLIGSTALASRLEPQAVVAELNAFFEIVVDCVSMHGGWVNKFEGDAALCIFGAPTSHPDAAGAALATARLLSTRLDRELPDVRAAIGVSAGVVVAGNVGAAERYEYTVIGDPVNEASRLTDMAKGTPGRLLASDVALERAQPRERDRWQPGETVRLRGRDRETV
ncbi:MAG: adenylate cyclase, partial [Thermoleophilaceae bacterium]|nr:adenylate cyclase [Thermoleophilaceae bacterium]